ncbi:hypothetical protein IG213_002288 [Escherichia coli]|nr:hypothetical protein [Escherichia coli]EHK7038803.1 hypothetical protein [Escherichia coli]EKI5427178.1 hypothetical protein [Escherichia coli]
MISKNMKGVSAVRAASVLTSCKFSHADAIEMTKKMIRQYRNFLKNPLLPE